MSNKTLPRARRSIRVAAILRLENEAWHVNFEIAYFGR